MFKAMLSDALIRTPIEYRRIGIYSAPESAYSSELERYLSLHPTNGVRIVEVSDRVTVIGVFGSETGPPGIGHVTRCVEEDLRSGNFLDVHVLYNI